MQMGSNIQWLQQLAFDRGVYSAINNFFINFDSNMKKNHYCKVKYVDKHSMH